MYSNVGTPGNEKEQNKRTQDEFHPTFACLLHADSYANLYDGATITLPP